MRSNSIRQAREALRRMPDQEFVHMAVEIADSMEKSSRAQLVIQVLMGVRNGFGDQ